MSVHSSIWKYNLFPKLLFLKNEYTCVRLRIALFVPCILGLNLREGFPRSSSSKEFKNLIKNIKKEWESISREVAKGKNSRFSSDEKSLSNNVKLLKQLKSLSISTENKINVVAKEWESFSKDLNKIKTDFQKLHSDSQSFSKDLSGLTPQG